MNTPIFVMGTARSGTTLVAMILGKHSSIFIPNETDFFDDIYSRAGELGDPQEPEAMQRIIERLSTLYGRYNHLEDQRRIEKLFSIPANMDEIKTSCKSYRDILTTFMHIQMRPEGKVRWGNNVPKDIFNIKEILSLYPDARILICIRDIRDFLASYKNFWRVGKDTYRKKMIYHPILTSFLWKASMKQIIAAKSIIPPGNLMIIPYESLVTNPSEMVRDICRVVQVEFEEGMLDLDWHNSSFQAESRGIYASSVGRWHKTLDNEETYLAQKISRRELEMFGYLVQTIKINPCKLAYIAATFPFASCKALYVNRAFRGPLISYLLRRIASLLTYKP